MFSYLSSNIIFNEIEYFTYLNIWLLCFFFYIMMYSILLFSSSLFFSSIYFNDHWFELLLTTFSLIFILCLISPALILLLDSDINILPSFIVQSLGYQWAWTMNCAFLSPSFGFSSYFDHYSIISHSFNLRKLQDMFYLFDMNNYLLLPCLASIKVFSFAYDVIHSIGFISFGIKIDAIPGRINYAFTLRSLFKGEHRGFCFELCGQAHSSMFLIALTLFSFYSIFHFNPNSNSQFYSHMP